MPIETTKALLSNELAAVNAEIYQQLETPITLINRLAHYLINSGGKRFRPMLTLLVANALGYEGKHHINLAALIEFIHTATLLHDDVIDDSLLRRGNETANAIWGNDASVLVGDFLFSRAFQMMVSLENPTIMAQLADTTNALAAGEVNQLMHRHEPDINEDTYFDIIRAKTAELFASACATPVDLCSDNPETKQAMYDYGLSLGYAFQLVDDALDYDGSEQDMGKNLGDDLAEGKMTLPVIRCLAQSPATQQETIRICIKEGGRQHLPSIQQAIASTDAIAYTYAKAQTCVDDAINALNVLPQNAYRTALEELARYAVQRRT